MVSPGKIEPLWDTSYSPSTHSNALPLTMYLTGIFFLIIMEIKKIRLISDLMMIGKNVEFLQNLAYNFKC
jgi:hypothetical protein